MLNPCVVYIFLYNFATKKVITMKFEDYNKLTEMEQLQVENELVHVANLNSFLLLTNELSIDDFANEGGLGMVMAHDLTNEPDQEQVLAIVDYFAEQDDYEKCILLRDMYLK